MYTFQITLRVFRKILDVTSGIKMKKDVEINLSVHIFLGIHKPYFQRLHELKHEVYM